MAECKRFKHVTCFVSSLPCRCDKTNYSKIFATFIASKFQNSPIKLAQVMADFVSSAKRTINTEDEENKMIFEEAYLKDGWSDLTKI